MNPSTVTILLLLCFICNSSLAFTASLHATSNPRKSPVELYAAKKKKPVQKKAANHEKWQPHYEQLFEYKEKHGHCNVDEDEPLGVWLKDQHNAYINLKMGRKSKLTKKRLVALEQIGAIPDDLWQEHGFTKND
jgi:hypothetical protein